MKNVKNIYSSAKNETTYIGGFCAVFLFMIDSRSFSERRFVMKGVFHNQSLVFFTVVIFLSYKEFNRIKSKHSCQVRKLVSPIHNRSKNGDKSVYSKKLIGWLRWGDSTNELHFWPQYTRVLFLIATFVIRLIHVCSSKSPLPQSKNWVLHVTRWHWWFMTELLKHK